MGQLKRIVRCTGVDINTFFQRSIFMNFKGNDQRRAIKVDNDRPSCLSITAELGNSKSPVA